MAEIKEALVPDIGDYSDIPVIEVLVAVGDTVHHRPGMATVYSALGSKSPWSSSWTS